MNKEMRICLGAVLLLPVLAQAGTLTLPVTLPTTAASSAKTASATPTLATTTSSVSALPQLPAATPVPGATGTADGGGLPLPGLEGLGGSGGLPIGSGIRPIRLPGPN